LPSRLFKLSTTLRLPRLTALKLGLSVPMAPGICRVESPTGGSTLITSAPRSARIMAQNGPAITCVTSSTRRPASARLRSVSFIVPFVPEGGVRVHRAYDLRGRRPAGDADVQSARRAQRHDLGDVSRPGRSEEHTSELQSRGHLVCRLLLEKKKN